MRMNRLLFIIGLILFIAIPPAFTQTYSSPNYTLSGANIAPGGGTAGSAHYSFHYCVIGSACGGRAASAHYYLQAYRFADKASHPRLSISLNPTAWAINTVAAGSSKIMGVNEKITVLNDGNIAETYSLQVIDSDGTWHASDSPAAPGINRYAMSGIFTGADTPPVDGDDFNESGGEDLILENAPQLSTCTKFATSSSSRNGKYVMFNDARTLWLKFDSPGADTTSEEHLLWVIVGAEVSE